MLPGLISFCLSRRPLVLVSFAAFLAVGYAAFTALNIEAYPDPAPPIIEIIAQYPGQSPEEMERYVTIPLEIAVSSTPGLRFIRSNTVYALSFIRIRRELAAGTGIDAFEEELDPSEVALVPGFTWKASLAVLTSAG